MPQESIPIGVEVMWSNARATAEMKAFEGQFQQFTARLRREQVEIPLKIDGGDLSAQIDDFTRSMQRDAIQIPVIPSEKLFMGEFQALVQQIQATPIQIPVTFVPTGGMGAGALGMAGGGGGGSVVSAGALATSAGGRSLAAPTAAAAGMFAAGTTFGYLRGGNYYPPAPLTASPMASPSIGVPPADAVAKAWAEADEGDGTASRWKYTGVGGGPLRAIFAAHFAATSIGNLADEIAASNPERFNAITNPNKQLEEYRRVREGQHQTLRDFGGMRFVQGLAATNDPLLTVPRRLALSAVREKASYDSEIARLNEAEYQSKRTDATLARRKQEGATVDSLGDQLAAVADTDSGMDASAKEKARASLDAALTRGLDAVDKKLKEIMPQDAKLAGEATAKADQIKAHLRSIHDKAMTELEREDSSSLDEMGEEAGALRMGLAGDTAGQRRARLKSQIARRQKQLDKQGDADADYYRYVVSPMQLQEGDRDENRREAGERFSSESAVRGYRTAESAAALNLSHRDDQASLLSANAALDERLAKLKNTLDLKKDVTNQKLLQKEYDAAVAATAAEKSRNEQRAAETRSATLQSLGLSATMATLRASGRPDMATVEGIIGETRMAAAQHAGDPQMQAMIINQGRSNLAEFMHGQDHPAIFNSMSGWASHVQESVLSHDPDAMREAQKAYDDFGKAITKFDGVVEKLGKIPAITGVIGGD